MKKATKDGFKMTGVPEMVLTSSPKMPYESLRSAAGEPFVVPKAGKNIMCCFMCLLNGLLICMTQNARAARNFM